MRIDKKKISVLTLGLSVYFPDQRFSPLPKLIPLGTVGTGRGSPISYSDCCLVGAAPHSRNLATRVRARVSITHTS